jgi:hypothetical protein
MVEISAMTKLVRSRIRWLLRDDRGGFSPVASLLITFPACLISMCVNLELGHYFLQKLCEEQAADRAARASVVVLPANDPALYGGSPPNQIDDESGPRMTAILGAVSPGGQSPWRLTFPEAPGPGGTLGDIEEIAVKLTGSYQGLLHGTAWLFSDYTVEASATLTNQRAAYAHGL